MGGVVDVLVFIVAVMVSLPFFLYGCLLCWFALDSMREPGNRLSDRAFWGAIFVGVGGLLLVLAVALFRFAWP